MTNLRRSSVTVTRFSNFDCMSSIHKSKEITVTVRKNTWRKVIRCCPQADPKIILFVVRDLSVARVALFGLQAERVEKYITKLRQAYTNHQLQTQIHSQGTSVTRTHDGILFQNNSTIYYVNQKLLNNFYCDFRKAVTYMSEKVASLPTIGKRQPNTRRRRKPWIHF